MPGGHSAQGGLFFLSWYLYLCDNNWSKEAGLPLGHEMKSNMPKCQLPLLGSSPIRKNFQLPGMEGLLRILGPTARAQRTLWTEHPSFVALDRSLNVSSSVEYRRYCRRRKSLLLGGVDSEFEAHREGRQREVLMSWCRAGFRLEEWTP